MNGPLALIFMGVAGSGKTTVAKLFAGKTGAAFYEGDDFHPPGNLEKMREGIPLTDEDRDDWLRALREMIARSLAKNELFSLHLFGVKGQIWDQLQNGDARVKFVYLTGPYPLIEERLKKRRGHFMPAALLASQFAILEPPADAMMFNCEKTPEEIVGELIHRMHPGNAV